MKTAKVLTAEDFVHYDLKEGGGFTLLIIHTNLVDTVSRPDEYHDDEARAFLAAIMAAAEEFPQLEVALLDSLAHPLPAKLLSACGHGSAECEALVFIGPSFADHRAVYYDNETKETLCTWLLGILLAHGDRQACSVEEALIWLAFNLAEPSEVEFINEARWDDASIRARALAAVTASMKTLHQNWYPWLLPEDGSCGGNEED